ncbi:rhodanese-like domain-containing protein [Bizionia argentinensis]|uniref:rhodanese-like domain-containing protein n=1 Tax=Bizionia argentinensis TaxID=456455 RepID=UPI0021CD9225|nr:rhodanese-like domain-containing protein [Bizionia argentinensis]
MDPADFKDATLNQNVQLIDVRSPDEYQSGHIKDAKNIDFYSGKFNVDFNNISDPKLKRMLVFNCQKEHWRLWMVKKYILPYLYWNKMLKGKEI